MNQVAVMPSKEDEAAAADLFERLLKAWNDKDAFGFSSLFSDHGNATGFDGSQMNGPDDINKSLDAVFKNHVTATYVWKIREVRFLSKDIFMLRAVAGMVPPGKSEISPSRNAIQSMIASRNGENWKIDLFQNTPAVFDGRPVLSMELTNELQALVSQ